MKYPPNPFHAGTQNHRLYERLTKGPIYNHEIVHDLNILKYTGRLSNVREAVRPYLINLEAKRIERGRWKYRLIG